MTDVPKSQSSTLTIDTHHHILPDFFWQATENAHAPTGGLAPLQWSKEASISFMDDAGIDVAVVSLSTPGVHTGDSAKARTLARRCNEFSAELVHARPDRFGGFACLPLPDVDASLDELSYALDVLGLDGFVFFTNSNGVYLGDPVLEPVFAELERRRTVVYVQPKGAVRLSEAQKDQAVLTYQQTIQRVFQEVSDALIAYDRDQEFHLEGALTSQGESWEDAWAEFAPESLKSFPLAPGCLVHGN